jgi:hypothetical protein
MIDRHCEASKDIIDVTIKSRYPFGKATKSLEFNKALIDLCAENFKMYARLLAIIDGLQERLGNVESVVRTLTEQPNVDLSSIKAEIAILRKQQLPKEARKYINEFREEWEEWKKKSQSWFRKSGQDVIRS